MISVCGKPFQSETGACCHNWHSGTGPKVFHAVELRRLRAGAPLRNPIVTSLSRWQAVVGRPFTATGDSVISKNFTIVCFVRGNLPFVLKSPMVPRLLACAFYSHRETRRSSADLAIEIHEKWLAGMRACLPWDSSKSSKRALCPSTSL